jgi:hypothetical protein
MVSGRVARIGEGLLAAVTLVCVQALEAGKAHVHLAPHLQHPRRRLRAQAQRHRPDGARVDRDVLAAGAVTTGGGLHQLTRLVAQAHRQPVELGLRGVDDALAVQALAHAAVEVTQLLLVECVAQRQHGHRVRHLRKRGAGGGAHPLGGGIADDQARMRRLQRLELAHQAVVLGVRDLRVVEHVVAMVVVRDLLAQPGGARRLVPSNGHAARRRPPPQPPTRRRRTCSAICSRR